jgi:hypothetical protein
LDETAHLLEQLLLRVMLPLWLLAGLGDWACHRVQRIEHNAGPKEALLHLAMLAEVGLGIVAALALQPTAGLLAWLLLACIAHELTTWWDLAYASTRRPIPPYEQWVHSLQLALPWIGLCTLAVAHRGQVLAALGLGDGVADLHLRWRDPPLPGWVWGVVLTGAVVLVVVPFLEEYRRCRAAQARAQAGLATIR